MDQLTLFSDKNKSQTFFDNIDPNDCVIDPFNSRKTRPPEHVEKLAARMSQYGYDKTRAVWARHNKDGVLSVFAGGTRLDAAKKIGIKIAVILHEGYIDEEIAWLTELDNESDEYHIPVGPVDTWAEYARLRDHESWTVKQIAKTKGCKDRMVYYRLDLHKLPHHIKDFCNQELLTETHLIEIVQIAIDCNFAPWFTTEQVWEVLAEWAAKGNSVSQTKRKVSEWKNLINLADAAYQKFQEDRTLYDFSGDKPAEYSYNERKAFINELVERKSNTQVSVKEAGGAINIFVAENLKEYEIWVKEQTAEAARVAVRAVKEKKLLAKIHLGDFRKTMETLDDDSVDLIFTDPPYDKEHIQDYGELAKMANRVLKPNGSLIVYAGHYALPKIFELMCPHLTYWWQLIVKHSGGSARQPGKWIFVGYKPLLWFVKGGRRDNNYVSDFIHSEPPDKSLHDWVQDLAEAKYCIERLTNEGDLVIDPFCGTGTTAIAALDLKRDFWICDIDAKNLDIAKERLLKCLEIL